MQPWVMRHRVVALRKELERESPPRDDYGMSRAWQVAVTKLEEAEMWLNRAQDRYDEHEETDR